MPFDESLAERIRHALTRKKGIEEKKMFGGIFFMKNGHMLVGDWKRSLIAQVGDKQVEDALLEPHVRQCDILRRVIKGWGLVAPEGVEDDEKLKAWIQRAVKFVGKLPAK
jgi:hypothetical protein